MLFYFVRHGDPIYVPDTLTPLGARQAEALGKRLSLYGLDRIYASSSKRAQLTAQPTCEMLKKEMEILDWTNEGYAMDDLGYMPNYPEVEGKTWLYYDKYTKALLRSREVREMRFEWHRHPAFANYRYKEGMERIKNETVKFLSTLGFDFDEEKGGYIHTKKVADRVALFAHEGFSVAFMSCLLNIPYPEMISFDISASDFIVVNFPEEEISYPRVLTYANDSHLYREGLPTKYQNAFDF